MPRDAVDLLLTCDLLRGVDEAQLRLIAPPPELLHLAAGETLIRQGEPGNAFHLLVHGRLRVFVQEAGGTRRIGEVSPGEGVGEMSLLTSEPTSATVRVMHDSMLVRFSRESFMQLMALCPEAALQVTRTVIKRTRKSVAENRHSFTTLAVVPLDPAIDTAAFTTALVEQISLLQPARRVTLGDLGPEHAAPLRRREPLAPEQDHAITAGLFEFERERAEQGMVVYQAEAAPIEWTRIAIRQADLVLLLGTVDGDPACRPLEQAFISRLEPELAPRTDLVMVHPKDWRARCGTRSWMAPRRITDHHHVRRGQTEDFARLARVLTGQAIGVVLGGGGARGLAELGALRALQEAGIPIDRVGGTSMGAIIGAMVALGHSLTWITDHHRDVWLRRNPMSDYTFPALSILRGRRIHDVTIETFADHQIEDLPIRFFCVSSNLTNAEQIVHDSGALWQGVRASSALPGTGPPLFVDGHVLVDGGVVNNLPVDVMRERFGGIVLAVDVSGGEDTITAPPGVEQAPSGWHILWRRLNPFQHSLRLPSIFDILHRTATLNSSRWSKVTRALADLVITPPVAHFGILDFKPFDAIVEAGYREAVEVLRSTEDTRLTRHLPSDPPPAWPEPETPGLGVRPPVPGRSLARQTRPWTVQHSQPHPRQAQRTNFSPPPVPCAPAGDRPHGALGTVPLSDP